MLIVHYYWTVLLRKFLCSVIFGSEKTADVLHIFAAIHCSIVISKGEWKKWQPHMHKPGLQATSKWPGPRKRLHQKNISDNNFSNWIDKFHFIAYCRFGRKNVNYIGKTIFHVNKLLHNQYACCNYTLLWLYYVCIIRYITLML